MSVSESYNINDFRSTQREKDFVGRGKALSKMYACFHGISPTGSSTATVSGGEDVKHDDLFTLASFRWLSNFKAVDFTDSGDNADVGQAEINGFVVEKRVCGATEYIFSRFLASGEKGTDMDFIWTKPAKDAKGDVVYIQIKVEAARISDWEVYCSNDYPLMERFVVKFPKVSFWFYHETVGGELKKGGAVTYDVAKHEMSSGHTA